MDGILRFCVFFRSSAAESTFGGASVSGELIGDAERDGFVLAGSFSFNNAGNSKLVSSKTEDCGLAHTFFTLVACH